MRIQCPNCAAKLKASEKLFGKRVKCPKCSQPISVPRPRSCEIDPDVRKRQPAPGEPDTTNAARDREPPTSPAPQPAIEKARSAGWSKKSLALSVFSALLILVAISASTYFLIFRATEFDEPEIVGAPGNIDIQRKLNFGDEFHYRFTLIPDSDAEEPKEYFGDLSYLVESRPAIAKEGSRELLPSREFGNGIALPGGYVVTSQGFTRGDAEVFVIVEGKTYPAILETTNKIGKFSIFKIETQTDFAKPIADPEEDLIVHPRPERSRTDPKGEWTVMFRDMKNQLVVLNDVNGGGDPRLPPDVKNGAILFRPGGKIAGFLNQGSVTMIGDLIELEPDLAEKFDSRSSAASPTRSTAKVALGASLVQVLVKRKEDKRYPLTLGFRGTIQIGENEPVQWARNEDEKVFINPAHPRPLTTIVKNRKEAPFFVGQFALAPFLMHGESGQRTWTFSDQVVFDRKSLFSLPYFDDMESIKPKRRGNRTFKYEVVDSVGSLVNLECTISIVPELDDDPDVDPTSVQMQQTIEFDLDKGLVTKCSTRGKFQLGERYDAFEYELELSDNADFQALAEEFPQPKRLLAAIDKPKLLTQMKDRPDLALQELSTVIVVPDEQISQAICEIAFTGRADEGDLNGIAANWIHENDLPLLVSNYVNKSQRRQGTFFVLKTLGRHSAIQGVSKVLTDGLIQEGVEFLEAVRVIRTKYPAQMNPSFANYLAAHSSRRIGAYTKYHDRLIAYLAEHGDADSIPILQDVKSLANRVLRGDQRQSSRMKAINGAIAQVNSRLKKGTLAESTPVVENSNRSATLPNSSPTGVDLKPPVLVNAPLPSKVYGYEIKMSSQPVDGGRRQIWEGDAFYQWDNRPLSLFDVEAKRPARDWGTGLGIPGKRLLVSTKQVANASSILVHIAGQVFDAKIENELPRGMTLLTYTGPDFAAPKVDGQEEVGADPMFMWLDADGNLETRLTFDTREFPVEAEGGILCHPWGRIAAMIARTDFKTISDASSRFGVAPFSDFQDRIRSGDPFDFDTPGAAGTFEEMKKELGKNLVRVEVLRDPERQSRMRILFDVDVRAKSRTPIITSSEIERLYFPAEFVSAGSLYASALGDIFPDRRNREKQLQLPMFLGDFGQLPFVPLTTENQKSWEATKQIAIKRSEASLQREDVITDQPASSVVKANRGVENGRFQIYELTDDTAMITRSFLIESQFAGDPELASDQDSTQSTGLQVRGRQTIEFDRFQGIVRRSITKGTIKFAETEDLEFEMNTTLLDDEVAKERSADRTFGRYVSTRKVALSPNQIDPRQSLADAGRESIIKQLESGETKARVDGLKLLASVFPQPDAEISKLLAENFLSLAVLRAERVLGYWILPQDISLALQGCTKLDPKNDRREMDSAVNLLDHHAPVDGVPKEIFDLLLSEMTLKQQRILFRQFPEQSESRFLSILESRETIVNDDMRIFHYLSRYGSDKFLPVLSKLRKIKNRGSWRDALENAIQAIESRNQ